MKHKGSGIAAIVAGCILFSFGYGYAQTHVMSFNTSKKGWLGVEIKDVTKRLKEEEKLSVSEGAYVTDVVEDSPAEEAGIKEGDVIVKLDGKTIDDGDDLTKTVQKIKPKTEVKVDIVRGSDKKTLTAKIGRTKAPEAFSYDFGNGYGNGFGNGFGRATPFPRTPRTPPLPGIHGGGHFFFNDETNGLDLQSLSKQLAEYFEVPDKEGMLVADVGKGSSAEKAGFKAGDVLTKVNGDRVRDIDDLHEALRDLDDKDARCEIIRKGKSMTLSWHIGHNSGGDDEDEEDMSYGATTPNFNFHMAPFHWDASAMHSVPRMNRFKEEMQNFKRELKEKLQDIRREIRAGLFNEN